MDIRTGRSIRHLHFRDAEVGHQHGVHQTAGWRPEEGKRAKHAKGWPLPEQEPGKQHGAESGDGGH